MIDDERLKNAAREAADAMLNSLPDEASELCNHTFSDIFTRKIKKLIWKAEHPFLYQSVRSVASILILILAGGMLLLSLSAEVRAAVFGWFKTLRGENHIEYDIDDKENIDMSGVRYETSWVPEGYELIVNEVIDNQEVFFYMDAQGYNAEFSYIHSFENSDVKILIDGNDGNYVQSSVDILGYKADLYISKDDERTSSLIWSNENSTLFIVSARLTKEELIKWAESVVKVDGN